MPAVPRRFARSHRVAALVIGRLATAPAAALASSVPATTGYVTNGSVNAIVTDAAGARTSAARSAWSVRARAAGSR